jgi:predicted nuclease of predicted toxin-antitoxin system
VAAVKLDENVPDSVGAILRRAGHDVELARDEQLAGVPDHALLEAASAEGRILVSLDRDFTNILQHPPQATPGIVVIRLQKQTLPFMRRAAMTLGDWLARESARGLLLVIDESRLRIWPRGGSS